MVVISANALLFDMDGVLVNSIPAVERVWRQWSLEHGFDPDIVVKRSHGRPSITTIRELLPDADHEAENRIVEQREIADVAGVLPLPGAIELLSALPMGRWAIVTSCTRALAEIRINAAGLPRPSLILTSTEVVHGKPHPEPYLKAAERLGFPPQSCIVVEDVPAGIQSGKAAGARVIALKTTTPENELMESHPDWICNNLSDIKLLPSIDGAEGDELRFQLA